MGATARLPRRCRDTARHEATSPAPRPRRPARSRACGNSGQAVRGDDARHCYRTRLSMLLIAGWPRQLISSECKYACAERPRVVIEAIPASNDVNLPGLATTETLTRHVNLNYFSEAVSWEGEERLADADSWRITGNPQVIVLGRISIDKRPTLPRYSFTWTKGRLFVEVNLDVDLCIVMPLSRQIF